MAQKSKVYSIDQQSFVDLCYESRTLSDINRKLGYNGTGTGNFILIRKRIKEIGDKNLIKKFCESNKNSLKIKNLTTEELQHIVNSNDTIAECLDFLGFSRNVGNNHTQQHYEAFKEEMLDRGIDITRFNKINKNKKSSVSQKVNIEEYFTKDNPHGTTALRRIILREKLIPYVCGECGSLPIWNNKELSLQLHHKDGDRSNNEISNLTFLCPNCHSQTENFAGRNNK